MNKTQKIATLLIGVLLITVGSVLVFTQESNESSNLFKKHFLTHDVIILLLYKNYIKKQIYPNIFLKFNFFFKKK